MMGKSNHINNLSIKLFSLALLLSICSFKPQQHITTIYMIGDSTMANKPLDKENQERGWGQMLGDMLQGNICVDNHAVNGRSSKSFIDEGRWDKVLQTLAPGDYVIIQFGHNGIQNHIHPSRKTCTVSSVRQGLKVLHPSCSTVLSDESSMPTPFTWLIHMEIMLSLRDRWQRKPTFLLWMQIPSHVALWRVMDRNNPNNSSCGYQKDNMNSRQMENRMTHI